MFLHKILLTAGLFFTIVNIQVAQKPAFLTDYDKIWVDSVFNSLSLDEKIGQLLMPRGNYSGKPHDIDQLEKWVKDFKIGGIVFFAGSPTAQAIVTNHLQELSKVPMLIGQDFEWGVGMRLDSTDRFPYAVTLGAMQGHDDWIERMGQEVARQCRRIGVHINYAPVVDVNNNPNNPVINFRSFGEDKRRVAQKGIAYMKGMQSQGLFCTAKHFPGHGDTDVDSHHDLPIILHDIDRLRETELYPFKQLIDNGLCGIMTAHLNIPALDATPNLASTFSPKIIYKLLREELKFEGLTFTDAMEMKGAVKNFPKGEAMVRALLAGNDILETFMDVPEAVAAIKEAVANGRISMETLNFKVKKILKAKSWVGLSTYRPISLDRLVEDLNTIETDVLNHHFAENSITCLKNDGNILPIKDLTKSIAVISLEGPEVSDFIPMVRNYVLADYFYIPQNAKPAIVDSVVLACSKYDYVLLGIHLIDIRASKKYGITPDNIQHIERLTMLPNVVTCIFGSPFILPKIPALERSKTLLISYQMSRYTESAAAQAIFGAIPTTGRLPMTFNDVFKGGMGIDLPALDRLSYGPPEMEGVHRGTLTRRMDSIVGLGLIEKAYPGCVLQIAKEGKVIFQKAYGYHTYEDKKANFESVNKANTSYTFIDDAMDNPASLSTTLAPNNKNILPPNGRVRLDDVYDLASITKISASTLALMQLMSDNKFSLDATLAEYSPAFKGTNKADLTFRRMLTHTSGLKAWIPFWKDAVDSVATIQKAIQLDILKEEECAVTVKKPSFIKRLFGKKIIKTIDYYSTANNPSSWAKALTPTTITWKANTFSEKEDATFTIQIADKLWLHKDYKNVIIKQMADSPLNVTMQNTPIAETNGYVYSDLHFYLYPDMIERLTGISMSDYLDRTYHKLGANSLTYNPLKTFPMSRIVPTEYDSLFRKSLIHGRVHDEGAIMLGGVSGHAGLFGNANDLMKLMQMYLQKGTYGGDRFISPQVIDQCTSYQYPDQKIRRGIGFDKKDFNPLVTNAAALSSDKSYGHSGFTGTYTWVDPEYDLVYVFLSNRVYPTRDNNKLGKLNIRTEIGNLIIKSIVEATKE